ncbi:hypothetical protein [Trujillonella endophytica]|uniref:DUF8129 domain-containing protein n=1 Tax=Trujillonella endophytica TaxID=673521 RepID=A0A1H8VQK5_9ACTN|nr:hypothetical protein [Trujillella endophytica]SEP17706.1 hypothetical protein SAMN05660991_03729 [Trujillella endophytica]
MPQHDELPIPDYDHLQTGALTSRIRTLDSAGLETLLAYERAHANRIQVVSAMRHRLASVKAGEKPSGGDPAAHGSADPASTPAGSKVSAATTGPPVDPPAHGDLTNPSQPRSGR